MDNILGRAFYDFEVIAVDNHSTDILSILPKFTNTHPSGNQQCAGVLPPSMLSCQTSSMLTTNFG